MSPFGRWIRDVLLRSEWHGAMALIQSGYDLGDLLAKKFSPAGGWVANVTRIDREVFELCSGNFPQGNDSLARK
jgi:hypothetical protein